MKYNKENFFTDSTGTFKQVHWKIVNKIIENAFPIWDSFSIYSKGESIQGLPDTVKIGNRVFHKNFVSFKRSLSIYYVSEDAKYLLRLSDHWSDSLVKCTNCGNIRF